jgi:hypothetical protein
VRYLVIVKGFYTESRPWVLAETPDRDWALSEAGSWSGVLLSREEASLDPDYREVLLAWDRGDDTAWEEDEARSQLEAAMNESLENAERELGLDPEPNGLSDHEPATIVAWLTATPDGKAESFGMFRLRTAYRMLDQLHRAVAEAQKRWGRGPAEELARVAAAQVRRSAHGPEIYKLPPLGDAE